MGGARRQSEGPVEVLLTHSYHLAYDQKQWERMQPFPPLGTLYAASLLQSHGVTVRVFDSMLRDPETFEAELGAAKPRIVAIYEDSFNYLSKMCLLKMRENAFRMAEAAHRAGAMVIAHGSDAADQKELYLRNHVDLVLEGEGEWSLLQAVQRQVGSKLADGEGPDGWPAIDRSLIDIDLYREAWRKKHGYFMLNLVSSRGCPFRCNWCAKPIFGDRYRTRSARSVAEEMLQLKREAGADRLWFADDIFGLDHRWLHEFAGHVEELGAALPFKIQARADLMTPETVRDLRRAGCSEVWMGAESGSQKILDAMEKGLRVQEVHTARRLLGDEGIRACYFLQFGYPGEGWDDIQRTIALVRESRPDDIGVSVSYPLPKTRFYDRVKEQLGAKRNWDDSDDLTIMFRGAYTDEFYRSIRNALHAEVENYTKNDAARRKHIDQMWREIAQREVISRNENATVLPEIPRQPRGEFFPVQDLAIGGGEA